MIYPGTKWVDSRLREMAPFSTDSQCVDFIMMVGFAMWKSFPIAQAWWLFCLYLLVYRNVTDGTGKPKSLREDFDYLGLLCREGWSGGKT